MKEPEKDSHESPAEAPVPSGPDDVKSERTEEQLGRAQAGSKAAARGLFHKLWRFLLERTEKNPNWPALKNKMDSEDVAQGLWVTLFHRDSLSRFEDRGAGSLRAWLGCCLDRHLVDLLRRQGAEIRGGPVSPVPLDPGDTSKKGPVPRSPDPGASTIVRFSEWVGLCRDALPEREYSVWRLRVDEGLDYDAIGERLDLTASAARGLQKRAVDRLLELGLLGTDA